MTPIKDRIKPDSIIKICYGDDELENPRFILGYWSIRGLGAPLRMMLSAAQVSHWVILYDVTEKDGGSWSKEAYVKDKLWLKEEYNSFMNLPFLVDCQDNDRVLAQTNAIFTYLGRELDMLGSNKRETSQCEELLCEIMDLRNNMVRFAYKSSSGNDEGTKEEASALVLGPAAAILDKMEKYLSEKYNGDLIQDKSKICYLVGEKMSAPDFHLYEMLSQYHGLCDFYHLDQLFDTNLRPHLGAFKENFASLPNNSAYLGSSTMMNLPYNNPYARFGSDPMTLGKYLPGQKAPWKGLNVVEDKRTRDPPAKKLKTGA